MALKFQYNKTELIKLRKDLKIRVNALPTLKNKESALRAVIKRYKKGLRELEEKFELKNQEIRKFKSLFCEFKEIVSIKNINMTLKKIAGVRTPEVEHVDYDVAPYSMYREPSWFAEGVEMIKLVSTLKVKIKAEKKRIEILEWARRKTTQKVNLYEKVQIPAFQEAIIKIRRFIEDQENLDRASQKIVKKRNSAKQAEVQAQA
jgi:V/A-type H+-transporting ATPase subunit D